MVSSSLLVRTQSPNLRHHWSNLFEFPPVHNGWQTTVMVSWFFSYLRSDYHRANLKSDVVFCSPPVKREDNLR